MVLSQWNFYETFWRWTWRVRVCLCMCVCTSDPLFVLFSSAFRSMIIHLFGFLYGLNFIFIHKERERKFRQKKVSTYWNSQLSSILSYFQTLCRNMQTNQSNAMSRVSPWTCIFFSLSPNIVFIINTAQWHTKCQFMVT